MSVLKDRTGEEKINHQGLKMFVDIYKGANKIKVRFENGYVTGWDIYSRFKSGEISNPYFQDGKVLSRKEMAKQKVGEIKKNSLGQEVKIIAFRDFNDIDVSIDDGTVLKNVTYKEFQKRSLVKKELESRIGETVATSHNGVQKLIAYNSYNDVTVEFDDGTIREHVRYDYFKNGLLSKREWGSAAYSHLGEITTNCQGLKARIVCFNDEKDILVKFNDGEVVRTTYARFKSGNFRDAKVNGRFGRTVPTNAECVEERQGMSLVNKYGELMKLINYRYSDDIDVLFEDGTMVKSTSFAKFKRGTLKNPNTDYEKLASNAVATSSDKSLDSTSEAKEPAKRGGNHSNVSHLGEEIISTSGEKMKVTAYHNYRDMEVTFEDGTVRTGVAYDKFKMGRVSKVKKSNRYITLRKERTGKEIVNKDGDKGKVIVYKSSLDVLVQFSDTSYKVCDYATFEKGSVRKPDVWLLSEDSKTHVGERGFSSDGENIVVAGYNNPEDILVRFSDGSIKLGVSYKDFKDGKVTKKDCYLDVSAPSVETSALVSSVPVVEKETSNSKDVFAPSNTKSVVKAEKSSPVPMKALGPASVDTTASATDVSESDTQASINLENFVSVDSSTKSSPLGIVPKSSGVSATEVIPVDTDAEVSVTKVPTLAFVAPSDSSKQYLFNSAESYRISAESLGTQSDSVVIAVALLYKNAIHDYLKYAVGSSDSDDIRVLGILARKQGIDIDPRDLAWINDFDFSFENDLLIPATTDIVILAGVVNSLREKVMNL